MSRDAADNADSEIQIALNQSLSIRRKVLARVGVCYCCGEKLAPQLLFCDADCAKLYEDIEKFKAIASH